MAKASLFAPVRQLDVFLKGAVKSMEAGKEVPALPWQISQIGRSSKLKRKDEFRHMVEGISQLVNRINLNNKFTKSWTFQMIHEVKTPLTILNREVEFLSEKYQWAEGETQDVLNQTKKISVIITNFLNWAEAAASNKPDNLHVIRAGQRIQGLMGTWGRLSEGRLKLSLKEDFSILCNPEQFDQLIENIVTNALKYSSGGVQIDVNNHRLLIVDQGPGLSAEVLERLGTPFNRGPKRGSGELGTGLGLAWIKTISDLYGWDLRVQSSSVGVRFELQFPHVES